MSNLREDQYTFYIVSCSFLSRMKNVSDKSCRENRNTFYVLKSIFQISCHFLGRPQMTVWHMWIVCWILKGTSTPSEYVILIAVTGQQQLHDCT